MKIFDWVCNWTHRGRRFTTTPVRPFDPLTPWRIYNRETDSVVAILSYSHRSRSWHIAPVDNGWDAPELVRLSQRAFVSPKVAIQALNGNGEL